MPRLFLLRHAKSSWELAGQLDLERGLLQRGRDDAALICEYMREHDIAPDYVICSSARRTRETLEGVAKAIPKGTEVLFTDDAYRATTEDLLDLIRKSPPASDCVLLVGHNPATHDLAVELANGGDDLERMAAKFPTAALAEFDFEGRWLDLGADGALLASFVRPKQLR